MGNVSVDFKNRFSSRILRVIPLEDVKKCEICVWRYACYWWYFD